MVDHSVDLYICLILILTIALVVVSVKYNRSELRRKQLYDEKFFFTPEMYTQFHLYTQMYSQLMTYNLELKNVLKNQYIRWTFPQALPVNQLYLFQNFLRIRYANNEFSRDWEKVKFPPYTKEHLNSLVQQLYYKTHGRSNDN